MASCKTFRPAILFTIALALMSPVPQAAAQTVNPFETKQLSAIAKVLGDAVQGKGDPANTPLALVTNDLSPFWTAGQIGSQRAASELGVPVVLNAPIKPGDKVGQQ